MTGNINRALDRLEWFYNDVELEYINKYLGKVTLTTSNMVEILTVNYKNKPLASKLVRTIKTNAQYYTKEKGCDSCVGGYVMAMPDIQDIDKAMWCGKNRIIGCTCHDGEIIQYLNALSEMPDCSKELFMLYHFCTLRGIINDIEFVEFDISQIWNGAPKLEPIITDEIKPYIELLVVL
jgi:hypothetical protein